jgi:predicted dehydrogenase
MAPVGFAVLGLGTLAQSAILPAFAGAKDARLVATISRDPQKAARLAKQYGAAHSYASLEECLTNPEVEAVYIVTPPANHVFEVQTVARAGRHVLCEKPLSVTAAEAEEMVATCARHSVLLMTAYRKIFEPAMLFVRELIREGRLGELKLLQTTFSERHASPQTTPPWILDRALAGGGPLMDLGVYCVHAARWLAQEIPVSVSAYQWNHNQELFREVEEGIAFNMYFAGGLVAQASTSYSAAFQSMLYLGGTLGSVSLSPAFPYEHVRVLDARLGKEILHQEFAVVDEFQPQIEAFAGAIRGGRLPSSCGKDGYIDMAIIEAIYRAAATGGNQVVNLNA